MRRNAEVPGNVTDIEVSSGLKQYLERILRCFIQLEYTSADLLSGSLRGMGDEF